jgi:hypothetical protein
MYLLHLYLLFLTDLQIGLSFEDVRMAVLVQRVVPAHYAFVIHTRNPSNNDEQEVFCELVRGLGELLMRWNGACFAFEVVMVFECLSKCIFWDKSCLKSIQSCCTSRREPASFSELEGLAL